MAGEDQSRFDPGALAREPNLLHTATAVLPRELFSRDSRVFHHAWVEDELLGGRGMQRIQIRDRLGRRLHGGLAGTLSTRVNDDASLGGAKADHGGRGYGERDHHAESCLASFVVQGVHSTRRAAEPSTVSRGRPTNPSGTGIA